MLKNSSQTGFNLLLSINIDNVPACTSRGIADNGYDCLSGCPC
jgi:hypothetical protein